MSQNKKYFWLKLKEDYFRSKEIKKLRKIAGGDTYTIIYLKMQLMSLKNNGILIHEGVEDSFAEELALELDEDPDNVKMTLAFVEKCCLIETISEDEYKLTKVGEMLGAETASTIRSRRSRNKKALQCNTSATNRNTEIEKETDIEKEQDIEKEREKKKGSPPHISSMIKNEKDKKEKLVQKRQVDFLSKIKKALEKRPHYADMRGDLNDFFYYWTERSDGHLKMRYEKETSFSVIRRLDTWFKNKEKWSTKEKKLTSQQQLSRKNNAANKFFAEISNITSDLSIKKLK